MNRLPAGVSSSLVQLKNLPLPAAIKPDKMPQLVKNLLLGQLAFYAAYELVSGPAKMNLKRYFTVTPESGVISLATFNLCHTSPVPLAINLGLLGTLGSHIYRVQGASAFLSIFGAGCAAASLAVALDARSNPQQVQAGSLGASSALLAYGAFKNPAYFRLMRLSPVSFVAAALAYGVYYDDKAVVAGLTAGYGAFLLAL